MTAATALPISSAAGRGRVFSGVLAGVELKGPAARLAQVTDPAFLAEAGWGSGGPGAAAAGRAPAAGADAVPGRRLPGHRARGHAGAVLELLCPAASGPG